MKTVLYILLGLLLGLFGLGFYMHDFDIYAYIDYLSNDGATNFSNSFVLSDPTTRLSFLYSTSGKTKKLDELTLLEQELAKFSGELKNENIVDDTIPSPPLSSGMMASGNTLLSGNTKDVNSGSSIVSTGESGDFLFRNGSGNTGNVAKALSKSGDFADLNDDKFDSFFDMNTGTIADVDTVLGSGKGGITSGAGGMKNEIGETGSEVGGTGNDTGAIQHFQKLEGSGQGGDIIVTGQQLTGQQFIDPQETGNVVSTGMGLPQNILQKRLKQYQEFKKTKQYLQNM